MPAGVIVMWSGLLANIPSGWALCDGLGGRPDLRSVFVRGAAPGVDPGATGGSATHTHAGHAAHVFTQPGGHAAHVFTQPTGHVFTQPGGHAAHVVTQPAAHNDVPNHTHPITDPGHVHDEYHNSATTGPLAGWGARDTSTNTPIITDYDTGSTVTGATVDNPAGGVASQPHSGAAVDAHSAHAGGSVDAHSGAAVDAHSAHAGGSVDAHSAHDAVSLEPIYFALAFIMKL